MKSEFVFGDFAKIDSGYAFKSSEWLSAGVPVVKIKNIKDGIVSLEDCAFVSDASAKRAKDFRAKAGDILISLTGYVGQVGRVLPKDTVYVNQRVGFVRPKDSRDSNYVYYLLRFLRKQIEHLGTGTAQANVSPKDIMKLSVPAISDESRSNLGDFLNYFDQKILINRALSRTLEDIAQTIFKSWFIDFDPIKAKMAGEKPAGMDDSTAALFPDSMEASELGLIPKGWKVLEITELGRVITGKTPSTNVAEYWGEDIPFVTIPDMHGTIVNTVTKRRLTVAGAESQKNQMLSRGSTMVSCIATPGLVVYATEPCQTNQQINSVTPKDSKISFWLYWHIRSLTSSVLLHSGVGTIFANLNKGDFGRIKSVVPTETLQLYASQVFEPLLSQIESLSRENLLLADIRDNLLPRLISGELQIPEEMLAS